MKATPAQINIIANAATVDSYSSVRHTAEWLGIRLFPESATDIRTQVECHPINVKWDEYRLASPDKKKTFLLPEDL
jgi:hypothetical protein